VTLLSAACALFWSIVNKMHSLWKVCMTQRSISTLSTASASCSRLRKASSGSAGAVGGHRASALWPPVYRPGIRPARPTSPRQRPTAHCHCHQPPGLLPLACRCWLLTADCWRLAAWRGVRPAAGLCRCVRRTPRLSPSRPRQIAFQPTKEGRGDHFAASALSRRYCSLPRSAICNAHAPSSRPMRASVPALTSPYAPKKTGCISPCARWVVF
jgi:hypothetical protein